MPNFHATITKESGPKKRRQMNGQEADRIGIEKQFVTAKKDGRNEWDFMAQSTSSSGN